MPSDPSEPRTYAKAGIDRGEVARSISQLLREARYRPPPSHGHVLELPGHYAGLVRIGRETIAVTTDTVGTKSLLAEEVGSWEEVGEDLVTVNANDLAAVGARPSALVDSISLPRPSPELFAALGRGIRRGLRASGMALIGGETAVVPELVKGTDLGGTAFGFFPRGRRPVTGAGIRPGDALIGVPSTGAHANGFTLIRRLLREREVDLRLPRPGAAPGVGAELLRASRNYVRVSEATAGRPGVLGFAHVSGGGVRNLIRLRSSVAFTLDRWPDPPGLFQWLGELGHLDPFELYQTFNMGIGFVVVVRPSHLSATLGRLARAGARDAKVIGHVELGRGVRLPQLGLEYDSY